ncbi:MAG: NnrU family protein [Candidatus Binataceae bacterium]
MDPVVKIAFWATVFVGAHLLVTSSYVRPRLVASMGEQRYRGLFSLLAFATLIPLVVVFAYNKHAGPLLWSLRQIEAIRWLAWIFMIASLVLLVAGLMTPSPAAVGAPADARARGVLKLTRHPSFVAFALFGIAHMLMNGFLGDVLFFGSFTALGILGGWHQDARKLVTLGESYRRFVEETSFFPGLALIRGAQHWESADTPWTALGASAVLTIVMVLLHPMLFGGSPLG